MSRMSQRKITSVTAARRPEVSCSATSRGERTITRQSTARMTMAAEEGSKMPPKNLIVV